jgi:hypothetical protein
LRLLRGELFDGTDAEEFEVVKHGWANGDEVLEASLRAHEGLLIFRFTFALRYPTIYTTSFGRSRGFPMRAKILFIVILVLSVLLVIAGWRSVLSLNRVEQNRNSTEVGRAEPFL